MQLLSLLSLSSMFVAKAGSFIFSMKFLIFRKFFSSFIHEQVYLPITPISVEGMQTIRISDKFNPGADKYSKQCSRCS